MAIDGPAGAGKSTVAREVARRLGFQFLDTGAMYRAVALLAVRQGVSVSDEAALARLAGGMKLRFVPAGTPLETVNGDEATVEDDWWLEGELEFLEYMRGLEASRQPQRLILDGEDVTAEIREPNISEAASRVSEHGAVRRELVKRQQVAAASGDIVLEGRDTTTVVCPDARLKIYLTASAEERARRRRAELPKDERPSQEAMEAQMRERDLRDSSRQNSPLSVAKDAVVLDTDRLSPDQVVAAVLRAWVKAGGTT